MKVQNQHRKAGPKLLAVSSKIKITRAGKVRCDKSFQVLLSCNNDDLVPLKFAFFKEIAHNLDKALRKFQTDVPMVPFLADRIEEILRELCNWFTLNSIMDGAVKTQDLIKIDMLDATKQKSNVDLGFLICNNIKVLKKNVKINNTKIANFKKQANNFYAHLLIQSKLVRCAKALNLINMAQNLESCKKLFYVILEKLVATKHFTSLVGGECKQKYALFLSTSVKDDKSSFQRFEIDNTRLIVFFMTSR